MSEYRKHKPMEVLTSNHYSKHVSAMTEEDLYGKAEIAEELAVRDMKIDELLAALKLAQGWAPYDSQAKKIAQDAIAKFEASK